MDVKETAKYLLSEKNPIAIIRRNKLRKALRNTTPTFLCPNCIGGILFHDLGLQFQSPMVNLMMKQPDFVKFVLNMDYYLSLELEFFCKPGYACPCAHLGDIVIHFTHYQSVEEAEKKWKERIPRIDKDNLFVFLLERDGLTKTEMLQLGNITAKGLVIFTANAYPEIPYALQIPKYVQAGEIGNILEKTLWNDSREYEEYFDFVKWFNEADGEPFSVSAFSKVK